MDTERIGKSMTDIPEQWRQLALYDLETAEAMFRTGRWMYVLFCCQQAVEKRIKGLISAKTQELPPRTHNLMRLAEHCGLTPDEATAHRLRALTAYYVESRYPDEVAALAGQVDASLAEEVLSATKEVFQWLESPKRS